MSAFIVSDGTMNRVVTAVIARFAGEHILNFGGVELRGRNDGSTLGRKLFILNAEAVSQRYGAHEMPPAFKWEPDSAPDYGAGLCEYLKAAHCLRYQCYEGTVTETALFKALDELCDELSRQIATGLDEYTSAEWDFA